MTTRLALACLLALLLFLTAYPLAMLVYGSLHTTPPGEAGALPAFAVGWILSFFIILHELSASILLYSVGNEVLPVVVMRLWTEGKAGQVSVIALVMLALVFLFRFGERRLVSTHLGWS
jgi:hypothetical protein